MFEAFNGLQAFVQLSLLDKVSKPLRNVENSIKQFSNKSIKELNKLEETFIRITEASNKLYSAGKNLTILGGTIIGFSVPFVWEATEFQKGMAEVSTLVDMSFTEFQEKYQSKLLEISRQLGQDTQDVVKAFYDAISSGFSPKEALGLITQAGKAAIAGVSDIATANDTLITILNSWKINLTEASDLVFKTIKYGKTTFNEIANSLGEVAPILSSVGVSFNEFSAMLAVATAKGLKTGPAMTAIREAVQSLIFPTESAKKTFQALGLTINRETLKTKGVVGTITEIVEAMKKKGLSIAQMDEYLSSIFGSVEAKKIVMQIMADPKAYQEMVEKFKTTNNETQKAFEKMSQSTSFQLSVLKQNFKAFAITIGTYLLPPFTWIVDKINIGISAINSFIERHKTLAKVIILPAVAIGGLIFILGLIISAFGLLGLAVVKGITGFLAFKKEITAVKTALNTLPARLTALRLQLGLTNITLRGLIIGFKNLTLVALRFAFSPLGIGLLALGMVIYGIISNLDTLKTYFSGTFEALKTIYYNYIEPFIEGFKIGFASITDIFEPLKAALLPIKEVFQELFGVVFEGFSQVKFSNEGFVNSVEVGIAVGKAFATLLKGAFTFIAPIIFTIAQGIKIVVGIIITFVDWIKKLISFWSELPTPIKFVALTILSLAVPFIGIFRIAKLILIPIRAFIGLLKGAGFVALGLKSKLIIAFLVIGFLANLWNNFIGWIKGLFGGLVNFISTNWRKILNLFMWINPITMPFMLMQKLISLVNFSKIINGIKTIYNLFIKLFNFLKSINLFEIGMNIINGLIQGMKAKISSVGSTIKNIGSKIAGGFKSFFGIQSPSKLFFTYGGFLTEGLALGIKQNIPNVVNTFNQLRSSFDLKNSKINLSLSSKETGKKSNLGNKIINIGKIIINYSGTGDIKEDSKKIADEVIFSLEDYLERA
jgi:TP901 family phage tail tape measure protein